MMASVHLHNLTGNSTYVGARAQFFFGLLTAIVVFVISGCAGMPASIQPPPSPKPSMPELQVVPNSIDFKTVMVGQTNTQTLQISNTGKATLTVKQIKILGNGLSLKSVALPIVLQSGQNQNIILAFNPTSAGAVSGTLSIDSNDLHPSLNIPVSGRGESSSAQLQVSPSSVSFGNLVLQATSTRNVTLSNTGNANVTINGVTVSGSGFGFSDLTPGFSLAPQQQVTFQVWFKPRAKGSVSGKLSIISANLASPVTMALTGDGTSTTTPPPSSHSVKLIREASPSVISGYEVYRGDASGGPYSRINASTVGDLTYVDAAVNSASIYFYVVTAVNGAGTESNFSNEFSIAIPAQ